MKLQIHAHRFPDSEEERKKPINDSPAEITIKESATFTVEGNRISMVIDGQPQEMQVVIGQWDHSALVLTYDTTLKIKGAKIRLSDPDERYGDLVMIVTLEDDSEVKAFAWFSDELNFLTTEVIGLTVEEARDLKQARDVSYLQS